MVGVVEFEVGLGVGCSGSLPLLAGTLMSYFGSTTVGYFLGLELGVKKKEACLQLVCMFVSTANEMITTPYKRSKMPQKQLIVGV